MYLKRLEIQGFKSFPEKTRLDFTQGITTVVGPNGSGKSNISDAVRWVLGEQSAKNLRGGRMEDVIFAGTQNRRALQFAEAALLLDNSDKKIHAEFEEIKISRRVYRSGEGEYFLNGVSCRLKDIHELFMDTGIGREGYSIIGQGRIDEILNAKSGDRRLLFEEAAGIVKYKNRKTEAENKILRERQNLTRINDITAEIQSQLGPLAQQSDTAKKFLNLSERLKLVRVNIFLLETQGADSAVSELENAVRALEQSIFENTQNKEAVRTELAGFKKKHEEQTALIKMYESESAALRSRAQSGENEIRLLTEKAAHTERDINRVLLEADKKRSEISAKNSVKEGFGKHRVSLLTVLDGLNHTLSGFQADYDVLSEALFESENKLNGFNRDIYEKMNKISEKRAESERLSISYQLLEKDKERLDAESGETEELLLRMTKEGHEFEAELKSVIVKKNETENKLAFFKEETAGLETAEKEEAGKLGALLKDYNTAAARLKLLRELEDSYEGYYRSVKAILTKKKDEPDRFKNIHGALGSLLGVLPGFETAVETALGSSVQNIVTETENDTKEAIAFLKENKLGRATFLPVSAVSRKDIGQARAMISAEPGFAGIAKELISYDAKFEGIFSNILGRVIVTDDFDSALAIFKKYGYSYKIVTKSGELLSPGGAITGGSQEHTGARIFGRGREISALSIQTRELRDLRDACQARLGGLKTRSQTAKEKSDALRDILKEASVTEADILREILSLNQGKDELIKKRETAEARGRAVLDEIVELNKSVRGVLTEAERLEASLAETKNEMERYQNELAESREEKDIKIKRLTSVKIEIAGVSEKLKGTNDNISRTEREIAALASEIEKSAEEASALLLKKTRYGEETVKIRGAVQDILLEAGKNEGLIKAGETALSEISAVTERLEKESEEITDILSKLSGDLTRQTLKAEQAKEEIKRLYDLMWEEYEITYNSAKQYRRLDGGAKELAREERELKNAVKALGAVNVGAIEEYREKKERFDFLTAQADDIVKAEESLRELIKHLNSLIEERFIERLTAISGNFNLVFSEMFGGGTAGILLTDEKNILESGIELVAQPPGKKLQTLSLLSGGERSLTAMALLFAILGMKPSPFCILDEIDAALDDANVSRFTNYIKNLSGGTQFILITHKKGTMAAADSLYGVTMQEQGVSKLVSVNLKEA